MSQFLPAALKRNAGLVVVFSSPSSVKVQKNTKTIRQTSKLWSAWQVGHNITNGNIPRPFQGGQDQDGVPQVPLLGHGEVPEP